MGSREDEQVKKASRVVGDELKTNLSEEASGIFKTVLETGRLPREALGFGDQRMEAGYAQAYHLYNTGKFLDAAQIFRWLVVLDATDPKYYLGLAACLHMLKEYNAAAEVYMTCSVIDGQTPIPFYHASDCYIQLRDRASAILMLELAIERAGMKPEYAVLKERARMMIEGLMKEIKQQENPDLQS